MTRAPHWLALLTAGLGLAMTGPAALADPPGVYYAWQVAPINTAHCLTLARQALAAEGLEPLQTDATSMAGRSEAVTAMFVCVENPTDVTTVMLVVASPDDEAALALRAALQLAF
ncbi:MAG: hypothetical protein EA368_10675 [Leptolyngbya sp. DLM2.Bin27]|nr:MAG: hypothetical protein EA368_10675 [Leptolyngbya sp. DLM2.Bin27]